MLRYAEGQGLRSWFEVGIGYVTEIDEEAAGKAV